MYSLLSWVSAFCVEKNDDRWKPMCSHSLNGPVDSGLMMGEEECTSPPGYYELLIPVDKNLECSASQMRDTNCKDLDVSFCKSKSLLFMANLTLTTKLCRYKSVISDYRISHVPSLPRHWTISQPPAFASVDYLGEARQGAV